MANQDSAKPVIWYLECPKCGKKFEKRGLILNPTCECGAQATVIKREEAEK